MSELDNLSEKQLVKMIAAKKMGHGADSPDYSQQYKRNLGDTLRDTAYGGIEGLWKGGKLGANILTGGNIEKIPGYKQYIPFMEKAIESIKSPYPSPGGEIAKTAGEFAPAAFGGLNALRQTGLVQAAARRLPSITRRGMAHPYEDLLRTAAEENVGNLNHPPELIQQIGEFLHNQRVPMGTRMQRLTAGQHVASREVGNTLGELSRALPRDSGARIGASNLHADLRNSELRELERLGHHETAAATRHADEHYRRSAQFRKLLGEGAKHLTGLSLLKAGLNAIKHI